MASLVLYLLTAAEEEKVSRGEKVTFDGCWGGEVSRGEKVTISIVDCGLTDNDLEFNFNVVSDILCLYLLGQMHHIKSEHRRQVLDWFVSAHEQNSTWALTPIPYDCYECAMLLPPSYLPLRCPLENTQWSPVGIHRRTLHWMPASLSPSMYHRHLHVRNYSEFGRTWHWIFLACAPSIVALQPGSGYNGMTAAEEEKVLRGGKVMISIVSCAPSTLWLVSIGESSTGRQWHFFPSPSRSLSGIHRRTLRWTPVAPCPRHVP